MEEKSRYNIKRVSLLRIKLVAVFSVLFAVAFAIISLASYRVSRAMITDDIDMQTQEVVNGHAAEIDQWISKMYAIVDSGSYLIEKGIQDDRNVTSDLFNNFSMVSSFSDIYYGSASGRFISGKKWIPPAGYDPRVRPWFTTAVRNRKTSLADIYSDYETNSLALSISAPVYKRDGSLRGVLSADLLLRTIGEKLKNIRVSGMGYAVLLDSRGRALVHPDKSLAGTNLMENRELSETIGIILNKKQGRVDFNTGIEKLAVFTTIPTSGWILGIVITKDEIYHDLRILSVKFTILFLISLIIVILTSMYFAHKLTYFMYLLEKTVEARTSELKEKIAEVEYLSLTDPLTGISNRRKIESFLKSEIERSSRTGSLLSVIMVDIDHFKQFNDTYGHETGDRVLKEFADTLKTSIRGIDLAGRIGGEEFLIVCPETGLNGAAMVAEKLRAAVESMKIESVDSVTASFGCASFIHGEDWSHLISRSDKALYRAKESGRNRIETDA